MKNIGERGEVAENGIRVTPRTDLGLATRKGSFSQRHRLSAFDILSICRCSSRLFKIDRVQAYMPLCVSTAQVFRCHCCHSSLLISFEEKAKKEKTKKEKKRETKKYERSYLNLFEFEN